MILFFSKNFSYLFFAIIGILYAFIPQSHLYILMVAWIYELIFALRNLNRNAPLLAFIVALFTFLMTRLVIPLFYTNAYIEASWDNTIAFNISTYDFIYTSIFVALISVHVGYCCTQMVNTNLSFAIDYNKKEIKSVREMSRKLYNFTLFFAGLEVLEKAVFVWSHSYLEYYLNFSQSLPGIVYKLSTVYELVFYIFLATMPSKREAKPILISYLVFNTLTLLIGGRSSFILACMFLIIYFYLRNDLSPNDLWISKKNQRRLIFVIPGICMLMFLVMIIRGGTTDYDTSILGLFFDFFFSQGSSMQVLGLTYEGRNSLPPDQIYSLGPLINVVNDNFIFHLMGIGHHFKSQTVEIALHGHSLGNYLTYTYQTDRFFKGGGLGSSYIAEAWADFGYFGIVIWSFIYGFILAKVRTLCTKNIWITALAFMMMMSIIFAPRANAISFVSNLFSPTYLLVIIFLYSYSRKNRK